MAVADTQTDVALSHALQDAFSKALRDAHAGVSWSFEPVAGIEEIHLDRCFVLTIASFRFRVFCVLYLSMNDVTREFVASAKGSGVDKLDEVFFQDYLMELSNGMCGNLKRNLQLVCPPLGMSTPNLLERTNLLFGDVMQSEHQAFFCARADGASKPLFAASVMVSLEQGEHDFAVPSMQDSQEADTGGELELF